MVTAAAYANNRNDLRILQNAYRAAMDRAGEEDYEILLLNDLDDLQRRACGAEPADMICVDITGGLAIETVEKIRQARRDTPIILIVDETMSPRQYIKPTILAASLIFAPIQETDAFRAFQELIVCAHGSRDKPDEQFSFAIGGDTRRIQYDDILFFESREKRVCLRTRYSEYAFYETLEHLENTLPKRFVRCHKSFIINSAYLSRLSLSKNCLWLEGEITVPVSRTYKPALKAWKEAVLE